MTSAVVIVRGQDGREFGFKMPFGGRPVNLAAVLDGAKPAGVRLREFDAGTFAATMITEAMMHWTRRTQLLSASEFNSDTGQDFTYLVTAERNRQGLLYVNVIAYEGSRGELPSFCGATGGFRLWAETLRAAA
jgi:hypothetical protein